MKKLFFAAALFSLFSFTLFAQDKPAVIEVTGSAEIKIVPDQMEMNVSINVDSDDLASGKNLNDESTSRVLDVLKKLNIPDKDIRTTGINMQKVKDTYKKTVNYTVKNSISFKTSDISQYAIITQELIKIDNVYIQNTLLTSTKAIETRVKAREEALLAAKKKAEEMAAVLNMSIGSPVMITENPGTNYPNPFNNVMYNGEEYKESNAEIFKQGMISISSSVKVVFLLK